MVTCRHFYQVYWLGEDQVYIRIDADKFTCNDACVIIGIILVIRYSTLTGIQFGSYTYTRNGQIHAPTAKNEVSVVSVSCYLSQP